MVQEARTLFDDLAFFVKIACDKFLQEGRRDSPHVEHHQEAVVIPYQGPDCRQEFPDDVAFEVLDYLDPASVARFGAAAKRQQGAVPVYLNETSSGKQGHSEIVKQAVLHSNRKRGKKMTRYDDWSKTSDGQRLVGDYFTTEKVVRNRTAELLDLLTSNTAEGEGVNPELLAHRRSVKKAFWNAAGALSSRARKQYIKTVQ